MRPSSLCRHLPGLQSVAAFLLAFALAGTVQAATATYSVALDTDSNPATGCTVAGAGGPIAGIEQIVTTVVEISAHDATIARLERQLCISGALGAPAPYDAGGWPVGFGTGMGGAAVVETSVPLSLLPPGAAMRATALSTGGGGQDATSAFAIALAPSVSGPGGSVTPVPLSPWLVPPLALGMFLVAAWLRRRYPQQTGLTVLVVVFAASGLVWAATVIRDGSTADWAGVPAAVTDPGGDAPANADLVAIFYQQDGANLYLRFDADIRTEATNRAPQVNAGVAQTITLPAQAALAGTASDDGLPNPPALLTTTWSKLSGPGTVTFADTNALATTAAFSAAGTYVLRLTASDGALSATADVTITVNPPITPPPPNAAPTVNAGVAQTITLPAQAALAGTASDDGLPNPPALLTTTWSKLSGPGTVAFGNANALATTAAFSAAGTYVLRLTASDGALSATADVTITVNPPITPPPPNAAPTVNAGVAQTITLPAQAALAGTASDDGLPNPPALLTTTWSKLSGPGTVAFGNANALATTAAFSAAGTYVLRLTASDSALSATADVTITVNPPITPPPPNAAPTVNAGSAQTITLPAQAALAGSASDDGRPNPPALLTTTWSKISGPGTVAFGNANALATSASFSIAGTYVLRLTASDSALSATSDVTITVIDAAVDVPPQIAPIADRTIVAGNRLQVVIQANDANGDPLTYSLPTAPAGAALRPAPLIDWVPSAAQVGPHAFTAQVSDGGGHSATASFTVTVTPAANTTPMLGAQENQTLAIGTPFTRALSGVDPDAGDTLAFSLVTGPSGMTLSGAMLNWSTSARTAGDYTVTVRVTDAAGAFDQKSFTVTLQASAAPLAVNDAYIVKPGGTLAVAAPGVLGNDSNPGGGALTAQKLTDPTKGVLSAFDADGSFTFVAPASIPAAISLKASPLWGAILYDSTGYAASADLNRDGGADVVLLSFGTPMAFDGKTGAKLWTGWDTSATSLGRDCRMYLFGTDFALGDVDGSGNVLYIAGTNCDGIYTAGVSNRLIGVDTDPAHAVSGAAAVRWVSERLDVQVPLPPSVGAPPVPTYVMSPAENGLTNYATPTLAKLAPGGGVKVLTRILIVGTQFPYDSDGDGTRDKNAGCMAATGNFADQGKSCTVTFIVDAVTGVKEAVLTAPNPYNQYEAAEREPLRQSAPVVADLDGDGQVEIISGTDVFKYNGTTWSLAWQAVLPGVDAFYEPLSVSVADVDGDGKAEVILQANWYANSAYRRGFLTYSSEGVLLHRFEFPIWDVGLPSIADVDGDGVSEILFAARGIVWAYHPDGTLAWASLVPDDDLASNPDDDPAVAHWPKPTGERTGGGTGLQVYDLDLDGIGRGHRGRDASPRDLRRPHRQAASPASTTTRSPAITSCRWWSTPTATATPRS